MTSPAADIASYIQTAGEGTIGAASGWSINVSKEPATPDTTITVYDSGGFGSDYDANIYQPTIQVRVRGNGYLAVHAKIEAINELLIAPKGLTVNTTRYVGAWQPGDIESLGYDENDRVILVSNYNLIREA